MEIRRFPFFPLRRRVKPTGPVTASRRRVKPTGRRCDSAGSLKISTIFKPAPF